MILQYLFTNENMKAVEWQKYGDWLPLHTVLIFVNEVVRVSLEFVTEIRLFYNKMKRRKL